MLYIASFSSETKIKDKQESIDLELIQIIQSKKEGFSPLWSNITSLSYCKLSHYSAFLPLFQTVYYVSKESQRSTEHSPVWLVLLPILNSRFDLICQINNLL